MAAEEEALPLWQPWIEAGGFYTNRADGSTNNGSAGRGETTLLYPFNTHGSDLAFGQFTGKVMEEGELEGNLALGYRRMHDSGFNFGAWLGWDFRRSESGNHFNQISGGLEALSHDVDLRLNVYGPVSDPQAADAEFVDVRLDNSQIIMIGGDEVAMMGADAEIGFRLPTEALLASQNSQPAELRFYGGGYHFFHEDAEEDITGGKARVELRFADILPARPGSQLALEYEITHDSVRDTAHDFGLRLRIPLGGRTGSFAPMPPLFDQERRMLEGIQRDTDIVTGQSEAELVEDAYTGIPFDHVVYVSNGTSISSVSSGAGANVLIIANGHFTGQQQIWGNQSLVGGGKPILVRGRRSGTAADFTAPGARAFLSGASGDSNLNLLGSNIQVAGLHLDGQDAGGASDGVGIGDNLNNLFLSDLNIQGQYRNGVFAGNDNALTLIDVNITDPDNNGVEFGDRNTVTILGGSVLQAGYDGVEGNNDNTILIDGLTISHSDEDAIDLADDNSLTLLNSKILNVAPGQGPEGLASGIQFADGNTITIDNSLFDNIATVGLVGLNNENENIDDTVFALDNVVRITNSTFSNIGATAIAIGLGSAPGASILEIRNSTFTNIAGTIPDEAPNPGADVPAPAVIVIGGNTSATIHGNTFSDLPENGYGFAFALGQAEINIDSSDNINASGGAINCIVRFGGSFAGSIHFVDGTTLRLSDCGQGIGAD